MAEPSVYSLRVRRELALTSPSKRRPARRLRLAAFAALLWGLASVPAEAQAPYRQEVIRGFSSLTVRSASNPDLADLDGDGDFDVVIGEQDERLKYFVNVGSSLNPTFVEKTGTANPFADIDDLFRGSPALGDLDGDGDLDLVTGDIYGRFRYFANTGSSTAPAFVERTGFANPLANIFLSPKTDPDLVDLDGDGDLDAVVGEDENGLRYFRNAGSSNSPGFVEQTGTANPFHGLDVDTGSSPELADLDGDGDFDMILGDTDLMLKYFENTGASTAPRFVGRSGTANPFPSISNAYLRPALGDLDGDGDLDTVVGAFHGSLQYFDNTGTSSAPAFLELTDNANPVSGIDVGYWSVPELVDLDGDADLDAVIGENYGSLLYFANTGSSVAPAFVLLTGTANPFNGIDFGYSSRPDLADVDGDGDFDAVVNGSSYGHLRYFANTGHSSLPAFVEQTGAANPFVTIHVDGHELIDLDGDGDLDLIGFELPGNGRYFQNTGSSTAPSFVEQTGTTNPFAGINVQFGNHPALADLDRDGDLDGVVGEPNGRVRYLENTGSTTVPAFVLIDESANPFSGVDVGADSTPVLADLDGDGDVDALIGEMEGRLVFFRSLSADIFSDGFESGDVSAWSAVVP